MREMPIRIVSDGVVTRIVRDTAAFLREAEKVYRAAAPAAGRRHHPPRSQPAADRDEHRRPRPRRGPPEVTELTRRPRRLLEDLGHPSRRSTQPVPDELRRRLPPLLVAARAGHACAPAAATHGRCWDPARLDNLTLGLDRHAARNLHRLPRAIARLRAGPAAVGGVLRRATTCC